MTRTELLERIQLLSKEANELEEEVYLIDQELSTLNETLHNEGWDG